MNEFVSLEEALNLLNPYVERGILICDVEYSSVLFTHVLTVMFDPDGTKTCITTLSNGDFKWDSRVLDTIKHLADMLEMDDEVISVATD